MAEEVYHSMSNKIWHWLQYFPKQNLCAQKSEHANNSKCTQKTHVVIHSVTHSVTMNSQVTMENIPFWHTTTNQCKKKWEPSKAIAIFSSTEFPHFQCELDVWMKLKYFSSKIVWCVHILHIVSSYFYHFIHHNAAMYITLDMHFLPSYFIELNEIWIIWDILYVQSIVSTFILHRISSSQTFENVSKPNTIPLKNRTWCLVCMVWLAIGNRMFLFSIFHTQFIA